MKHEWKKNEKQFYSPKNLPELIDVPSFKFFTIEGTGNPNDDFFAEYIGVLYSLSYAVKMSYKKGIEPEGYFEYAVYPLEGLWTIDEKPIAEILNKDALQFKLMIRQPDFVDEDFAALMLKQTKEKKPHKLLDEVKFESIEDGKCVQMLHIGSYDDEPQSFNIMESFAEREGYIKRTAYHREIYLNDARKTDVDKLKTILRFSIDKVRV